MTLYGFFFLPISRATLKTFGIVFFFKKNSHFQLLDQTLVEQKDKQLRMKDNDIFSYQSIIAG